MECPQAGEEGVALPTIMLKPGAPEARGGGDPVDFGVWPTGSQSGEEAQTVNHSAPAASAGIGGFKRGYNNDAPEAELCCCLAPASSLAPRCGRPAAPPQPSWKAASA